MFTLPDFSLLLFPSVLFKLGESVQPTSPLLSNRSTFFHPLADVSMTTVNGPRPRAGRQVGQQTFWSASGAGDTVEVRHGGLSLDALLQHMNDQQGCL